VLELRAEREKQLVFVQPDAVLDECAERPVGAAVRSEGREQSVADPVRRRSKLAAPLQVVPTDILEIVLEGDVPRVARLVEAVRYLAVGVVVVRLSCEAGVIGKRPPPARDCESAAKIDRALRARSGQGADGKVAANERALLAFIRDAARPISQSSAAAEPLASSAASRSKYLTNARAVIVSASRQP
jgi:hypothetical protein